MKNENKEPMWLVEEVVVLGCGVVLFYGFDLLIAVLRG